MTSHTKHIALLLVLLPWTSLGAEEEGAKLLARFRKEFVKITPGKDPYPASFQMGSTSAPRSRPPHKVTLKQSFYVAKYEVPQNLWEAVMGNNPSRWKGPRNSVEMLHFAEARAFCARVTKRLRAEKLIGADMEVRLPSEAEWEYFARAGSKTSYSFGDDVAKLDAHAWSTRNAAGNDPPVGAKKPNPWGLYDIHGYLWEWCLDDASQDYTKAHGDPRPFSAGKEGAQGVLRGGSWKDDAPKLTSHYRRFAKRDLRDDAVGLRCVLAPITRKSAKKP